MHSEPRSDPDSMVVDVGELRPTDIINRRFQRDSKIHASALKHNFTVDSAVDQLFCSLLLHVAQTHATAEDGARNPRAIVTDLEAFSASFKRGHSANPPSYQWIFDEFWTAGLDRDRLEEVTRDFLDEIRPLLEEFIRGEAKLRRWVPEQGARHREFIESLEIPSLDEGGPDMLLHNLGRLSSGEIGRRVDEVFKADNTKKHTVLLNTSGSGKTRVCFEGLCTVWGFYFTAWVDPYRHGSTDLQNCMDRIEEDGAFKKPSASSSPLQLKDMQDNSAIAHNRFTEVMYSRLAIFELFCRVAKSMNGNRLEGKHRKWWLILQLKPSLKSGTGDSKDIFRELSCRIQGSQINDLHELNETLGSSIRDHLRPNFGHDLPIFCVVDEAQAAATRCYGAFASRSATNSLRSILRDLVLAWVPIMDEKLRILLCGTGLPKTTVEQAVASAVLKANDHKIVFDIGGFDGTTPAQWEYIQSLIPKELKQGPLADKLCEETDYWLRGRYRFTSAYMQELLIADFEEPLELLQSYINACTTPPQGSDAANSAGFLITGGELDLPPRIERTIRDIKPFNLEKLSDDNPELFEEMTYLISDYLMRSSIYMPTTDHEITKDEYDAVERGFGRIGVKKDTAGRGIRLSQVATRVTLDEGLIILRALQWLGTSHKAIHRGLALRAERGTHESRGGHNGLEEYLAYLFTLVFDGTTPLEKIFIFHASAIPTWAKKGATLISLFRRKPQYRDKPSKVQSGRVSQNARPSVALGFSASKKFAYSKGWLTHNIETPFFFPDVYFGPDILFILELNDENKSRIWVAVQSKFSGRKELDTQTLDSAVRSVTPSRFYLGKDKPETKDPQKIASRQKAQRVHNKVIPLFQNLEHRLPYDPKQPHEGAGTCSVLRVVAGWKADV
ncbi:hypothetical protein FB45DRAFT_785291 [Roridomyces roridus]|uniref:Uncharacterized protein n=1 Tax=Roridomyces roridus TaxID=1738132 RepID=A0AAD7C7J6_9AGAR|nr:hypothetical protein FB45DRAFT_785291 [Roridomyces roridus]